MWTCITLYVMGGYYVLEIYDIASSYCSIASTHRYIWECLSFKNHCMRTYDRGCFFGHHPKIWAFVFTREFGFGGRDILCFGDDITSTYFSIASAHMYIMGM